MTIAENFYAKLGECADTCDSLAQDAEPVVTQAGVATESLQEAETSLREDVIPAIGMAVSETMTLEAQTNAAVQAAQKMDDLIGRTLDGTNNPTGMAALDLARQARTVAIEGSPGDLNSLAAAAVGKIGEAAVLAAQLHDVVVEAMQYCNLLKANAQVAQDAGRNGAEEVRRYIDDARQLLGGGPAGENQA